MDKWREGDVLSWREIDFGWEVRNDSGQPVEIAQAEMKASAGGPVTPYIDGVQARDALPLVLEPQRVMEVSRKAPHMSESLQARRSQEASHPMHRLQVNLLDAEKGRLALLR